MPMVEFIMIVITHRSRGQYCVQLAIYPAVGRPPSLLLILMCNMVPRWIRPYSRLRITS